MVDVAARLKSNEPLADFVVVGKSVYASGTNVLYQLDASNLEVEALVKTGPHLDSAKCHASGCGTGVAATNVTKRLTDNANKALVVDSDNGKLIVCGSLRQGSCSKYELRNISSGDVTFLPEAVAANDDHSSTFAFVGPQRYNRWGQGNVLYVGTTYTSHGDYRHDVPAISSRHLLDLSFAEYTISKQSTLRIDVKYRDRFLVNYVYGFNSSSHVYFVTVQRKSHLPGHEEQGYITRISRVCVTDPNFDTYTEVTLECGGDYNIVQDAVLIEHSASLRRRFRSGRNDSFLAATFSKSQGSSSRPQNTSSAICLFSLADINRRFDENIHNCFNGSTRHRNMEYISGTILEGKCPDKLGSAGNIMNFCEVGLKISGRYPIRSQPVHVTTKEAATSVDFGDVPQQHSGGSRQGVLTLGTSTGRILVVLIDSNDEASRVLVTHRLSERTPVTKVRLQSSDYVMALQRHTLTRLPVSNCDSHTNCGDCVAAQDPFCGWCALMNKCTHMSRCNARGDWLSTSSRSGRQCSRVEQVIPSSLSLPSSASHVTLLISALPTLPASGRNHGEAFVCVYGQNVTAVRAKPVTEGLQCAVPSSDAFAAFLAHSPDADSIQLDIRFANLGTTLLTTHLKLLDCAKAESCGACTSHPDCHWCLNSNTCVAANDRECFQYVRGRSEGVASVACPKLQSLSSDYRVPNDVPIRLQMSFEHLPSYYNTAKAFWCLVHIEEAKFKVSAQMFWDNATIVCDETLFNYNAPLAEIQAKVSVLVNPRGDVLDTQSVTVYKCSALGSYRGSQDCTLCSARRTSHGCSWCPSTGCVSQGQCPDKLPVSANGEQCPGPEIFLIRPTSGPPQGGTVLTIEGSNLGTSVSDLRGRIKIGGRDCTVLALRNSVEATCLTPPAFPDKSPNATVVLRGRNNGKGRISRIQFHYLNFSLTDFSPTKGAASGGALVRIRGQNLHIGTKVSAFLDEVPCTVDQRHRSASVMLCTTGSVGVERVAQNLTVVIDGGIRTLSSPFFYTPDPIIHEIKPLTSFASGGRVITVHGEYLDSVTVASLLVFADDNDEVTSSDCHVFSSRLMECRTPPLQAIYGGRTMRKIQELMRSESGLELRLGLHMDNATSLRHLHRFSLVYMMDPAYENFTNHLKVYKGDALVIEGRHLNAASDQNDVRVTIGSDFCNITSLTQTQLLCVPPASQPPPNDDNSDLPEVTVLVGSSLRYQLGYVRYNVAKDEFISSEVIGAISAVTAILVSIGIVILIVLKHKSSQVEREYKRIQIQMDILENNVRSECKQAFAELQTDLTDLTIELEATGIPIVPHRTYVMNVFFPGVSEHPVLLKQVPDWQQNSSNSMFGFSMVQFEQLLLNKVFLVTLVDTVERQPTFGIRDRVNLASLLSIVLMTRMDYFSEVLRLLLLRQIDRALRSRHPQLMLRRTETVVEKLLTNWLALCMHGHLEQKAGTSLFLLYKAIKCQVEKGPVDLFTQEAKYSLSEEGLLKESMPGDYSTVTCLVLQRELDEAYHAKVLDCDAITQVKAKILDAVYKNTAFSLRPNVDEVDLEWQCGQDAHVVLKDYDLTTKEERGGLKKVNTLRHYGIKNKAVVSLVPVQFNLNGSLGRAQLGSRSIHLRVPDHVVNGGSNGVNGMSAANQSTYGGVDRSPMKSHKSIIPEVFLTRLLSTKGTVKKFIDDFFRTILCANDNGNHSPTLNDTDYPPCAIKWLFDIFDSAAIASANNDFGTGGYVDDLAGVVHAWKSNSVPLRFWITLIKNPHFVFDVEQTPTTELNLSIVAQTLMSACFPGDGQQVSKEAPSHKLLFARDIAEYRDLMADWYEKVQKMPQVTDQDLNCYMHGLSQRHASQGFNQVAALKEIFLYVSQYYHELATAFSAGGDRPDSVPPSPYHSQQHIYQSPQSPSLQPHQDLSIKLERIFKIVKDSDHYVVR